MGKKRSTSANKCLPFCCHILLSLASVSDKESTHSEQNLYKVSILNSCIHQAERGVPWWLGINYAIASMFEYVFTLCSATHENKKPSKELFPVKWTIILNQVASKNLSRAK
jgi:hypothetical protein